VLQVRAASACCKHEKAPIGFLPVGAFLLADLTKSAPKTASIEKNRLYQKGKRGSTRSTGSSGRCNEEKSVLSGIRKEVLRDGQ
jgi:hypothetical protein